MSTESMLECTDVSRLIIEERTSNDVVVGVPHHAPAGTPTLPCPEHPDADENAGFLGRYVAEALECHSIIACNYTKDVNKSSTSNYTTQIEKWKPKVLIEIHGHGAKNAKHDIEISSGSSEKSNYSERLATELRSLLANDDEIKSLSICGEYSKIYFKAHGTVTISRNNKWVAYHIELPPTLRKSSNSGKPPTIGYRFCDALTKAVIKIHRS